MKKMYALERSVRSSTIRALFVRVSFVCLKSQELSVALTLVDTTTLTLRPFARKPRLALRLTECVNFE